MVTVQKLLSVGTLLGLAAFSAVWTRASRTAASGPVVRCRKPHSGMPFRAYCCNSLSGVLMLEPSLPEWGSGCTQANWSLAARHLRRNLRINPS